MKRSILAALALLLAGCAFFRPADSSLPGNGAPGIDRELQKRQDIVGYAGQFIGSKYQPAGKNPGTGFDCSGFTSYVFNHFDVSLSPSSKQQETQGRGLDLDKVRPGDLIFFRRTPNGDVFHVSLVVSNNRDELVVIHSVSKGVIRENIRKSSYWMDKYITARDVLSGGGFWR